MFLLLLIMQTLAQTNPKYLVTAPNILRLDVEESVVISVTEPVLLELYLDYPASNWRTDAVMQRIEPGVPTEIKITAPSNKPYADGKYIFLKVRGTSGEHLFEKEVKILVTPQNGFVFIQTDKPIYKPNQEVQVRVVQVDHLMKPRDTPVRIDVLKPNGIVVQNERDVSVQNGLYSTKFTLSALPDDFGKWSIKVHYGENKQLNETVQFEVEDYVLPTFSVKVKTPEYILNKIYNVPVEVQAQYVFGKNVCGPVTIRFGVKTESELKIFGNKKGRMTNAGYKTSLSTRDIAILGPDFWFLKGAKLYVEATVREHGSGIKQVGKTSNTRFVTAPYNIKLSRTPSYFKPGLSFTAEIDVTHVNGKPVKGENIHVSTTFRSQNGDALAPSFDNNALTNEKGQASVTVNPPTNAYSALIQVSTRTDVPATEDFNVRSAFSSSNSYLLATVKSKQPVAVGNNAAIEITATKPSDVSNLVHMVISGARSIKTGCIERPSFPYHLSIPVETSMSPSARLLVYYVHGNEVVADSVPIDVVNQCRNQVAIETNKREYKPGDFVKVKVTADAHTKVAILAVDQAVYLMNSKYRLAPEKVFDSMRSFDTGCGVGGGLNSEDLLQSIGLTVLSNTGVQGMPRTTFGCSDHQTSLRKRRTTSTSHRTGNETNSAMTDTHCCDLGRQHYRTKCVVTMGRKLVGVSASCRMNFLKCCNEGPLLQDVNLQGRSMAQASPQVSRPEGAAVSVSYTFEDILLLEDVIDEIPGRQNFDETWMFKEIEIGSEGFYTISTTAPDSITTWVVQAFGINQDSGFCVAEPTTTKVFTEFFIQVSLPHSVILHEQVEVRATIFNYGDIDLLIHANIEVGPGLCANANDPVPVKVQKHNSVSVTFPVVPLDVGEHSIELIAHSALPLLPEFSDYILKLVDVIPPHCLQRQILTQGVATVSKNSQQCRYETNVTMEEIRHEELDKLNFDDEDFTCPGATAGQYPTVLDRVEASRSPLQTFHHQVDPRVDPTGDTCSEGMNSGTSSKKIAKLRVCTKFLASRDSGMSVIEVGLISGFQPFKESLDRLIQCKSTTFVENYHITSRAVEFDLSKVPHDTGVCLEFFIQQHHQVSNIQPVAVYFKDNSDTDSKCTTFYHPDRGSELLKSVCSNGTGRCCRKDRCPTCYNVNKTRYDSVHPEVAYLVEVLRIIPGCGYKIIKGNVPECVIKQAATDRSSSPVVGSPVTFWLSESCKCNSSKPLFEEGKMYVIEGPEFNFTDITDAHSISGSKRNGSHLVERYGKVNVTNMKECTDEKPTSRVGKVDSFQWALACVIIWTILHA